MTIVRAKDRVIDPANSVQSSVYDPIAPSLVGKAMQPFVVHPASVMGPKFMDHTGEEFVFVHSGSVEFEIPRADDAPRCRRQLVLRREYAAPDAVGVGGSCGGAGCRLRQAFGWITQR